MATPITAEAVFNTHAAAHGLPLLDADDSIVGYIDKHAQTDEAVRCFKEAFTASSIANHGEAAHWFNQARQHYTPPARSDRRS